MIKDGAGDKGREPLSNDEWLMTSDNYCCDDVCAWYNTRNYMKPYVKSGCISIVIKNYILSISYPSYVESIE